MGSKTLSQEYEFSEGEESPIQSYKPLRSRPDENSSSEKRKFVELEDRCIKTLSDVGAALTKTEMDFSAENVDPRCTQRKVIYMYSEEMIEHADKMIKVPGRVRICHTFLIYNQFI